MKFTPQQLRETADAIEAHKAGRPVQYQLSDGSWMDIDPRTPLDYRSFYYNLGYRPKPEPKVRPWSKPEDVPGPVCWVRFTGGRGPALVVEICRTGFYAGAYIGSAKGSFWNWVEINSEVEYSTDRVTWKPCTVTEES